MICSNIKIKGRRSTYLWLPIRVPKIENTINATRFTKMILAPVGVLTCAERINPITKFITPMMAADIITDLKLLKIRIAMMVGKIIKPEMSKAPIRRIPKTTTTAVNTARIEWKRSVF